jgi:hypothetical protein
MKYKEKLKLVQHFIKLLDESPEKFHLRSTYEGWSENLPYLRGNENNLETFLLESYITKLSFAFWPGYVTSCWEIRSNVPKFSFRLGYRCGFRMKRALKRWDKFAYETKKELLIGGGK